MQSYYTPDGNPIPKTSGIYRITCIPTGKFYIGSTANLYRRYMQHFSELRNKDHCNQKLQNTWNKYGSEAFVFEIIELVLPPLLLEREQYWIDKLRPFFNLAPVAGSLLGIKRTPEAIEKTRRALLGKPSPMRGIPRTPETIEKLKRTKLAQFAHISKERICEGCGIPFPIKSHRDQRFCSRRCSGQLIANQIYRICIICGKDFHRKAAKISDYCSAECSYQAKRKDIAGAFWSKVEKTDSCWLWTGARAKFGHGLFTMGKSGRTIGAHRFAYEQTYGEIPDGMLVCHHCDNPSCVRPDHLFLGTYADNNRDKVAKNRQAKGQSIGNAKLTEDDVRAIRAAPGGWGKIKALAEQYGVNSRTIISIRNGKLWKHV